MVFGTYFLIYCSHGVRLICAGEPLDCVRFDRRGMPSVVQAKSFYRYLHRYVRPALTGLEFQMLTLGCNSVGETNDLMGKIAVSELGPVYTFSHSSLSAFS